MEKEKLLKQREYRKRINNSVSIKYEKTINGFLMRLYRNMLSRVTGIQKEKYHLYKGKDILDRPLFYEWSKSNSDFLSLYHNWKNNNYDRKLTPSVDRVNPNIGYTLSNMEWVTHSENSRRGGVRRQMKI